MRKNDARQQFRTRTFEPKRNLFGTNLLGPGTADVTMCTDPRFHTPLVRLAVRADHNCAAGMVFCDPGDKLRIFLQRTGLFVINGEIDERGACHRAFALRPKFF